MVNGAAMLAHAGSGKSQALSPDASKHRHSNTCANEACMNQIVRQKRKKQER
jgi:hypothetical protein